jgi:hypothetical protein
MAAAGRGKDKSLIVDGVDASYYRPIVERAFSQLTAEQREMIKRTILKSYGGQYGNDTDIVTILISEHEKKLLAHEIEHTLGAKHPDEPGSIQVTKDSDPQAFKQSIMSSSPLMGLDENTLGKILGRLDIERYQRHFGVKDIPGDASPVHSPMRRDKLVRQEER